MFELYRFAYAAQTFTYTDHHWPYVHNNETYEPVYITRNRLNVTESMARSSMKVTIARDAGLVALYNQQPPSDMIEVQVFQHDDGNVGIVYVGRVLSVSRSGSLAELTCEPIYTSLKNGGLRRRYQRLCPYALYDSECRVSANQFKTSTTVDSVGSNTVSASAFSGQSDGWYTGGYVEVGAQPERRSVVGHSGDTLQLTAPLQDAQAGDAIDAYAGCDHTRSTCQNKFNNLDNFGGLPWIPRKNPFGNDPIF